MNILDQINRDKQKEVDFRLQHISEDQLEKKESDQRIPRNFLQALKGDRLSIIAEVKKASPSKGIIRPDFDPVEIAKSYEKFGAECISVLTEESYFKGDPKYLVEIRQVVNLPLLRKDFIVDPRQIRESYDLGADAILLIVASLSRNQLQTFLSLAKTFNLTVLVEVHSLAELERSLECGAILIGVNNRNLTTFQTDLQISIDLKKEIPNEIITISESGIHHSHDCHRLGDAGFDAILVGESLMRNPIPGEGIEALLGKNR